MSRTSYNGFSPDQRTKAGGWAKRARARGELPPIGSECFCCTSTVRVAGHSEDYSEPYGPHIGAFDLCWQCHMMIHCRTRNPVRFAQYVDAIEVRRVNFAKLFTPDFDTFAYMMLNAAGLPMHAATPIVGEPEVKISDVGAGLYNPAVPGSVRRWAPEWKAKYWEQMTSPHPELQL